MNNKEINDHVRVRMGYYMIHFDNKRNWLSFEVYPIEDWKHIPTQTQGTNYIDKEKQPDTIEKFKKDKCLKKLSGSFGWRGLWEGKLYFTDDEYWGEEIEELSILYNDKIVPWCKNFIKKIIPMNITKIRI